MKKSNFIILCVLTIIIVCNISLVSCVYNPPEPAYKKDTILPAITTTGANTFGCKLNGSYWLAVPNKSFQASFSKGGISIVFDMSGDNKWSSIVISSYDNQILNIGKYYFSKKIRGSYFGDALYRTSDTTTLSYLNILRLDSTNRIISGTFEFCPENALVMPMKVYITEGRFDIKY